jgi:hypothetical protein
VNGRRDAREVGFSEVGGARLDMSAFALAGITLQELRDHRSISLPLIRRRPIDLLGCDGAKGRFDLEGVAVGKTTARHD